jgi:hypothetical protein
MIELNPWITGGAVGLAAGCAFTLFGSIPNAIIVGGIAWVAFSWDLQIQQQAYEAKLLFQQRLYGVDVEKAFALIQRAMANVWLNESHWQNRTTDLSSGFMLYRYEWREPKTELHDDRIRHHANLQIDCEDRSDAFGASTLITFSFDGLPNSVSKRLFYYAVELAMESIDSYLPDFTFVS